MKDLHGEDYIYSEDVIENVDELENDIQTLREELDELTQELDTLEGEINALSSARDRQCQELDILVSERKEREDKGMSSEDITEKIEDINTHLTGLEDELKAGAKEVEKVKDQIDDRKKTLSDTEEELRPYKDFAEQCENYGEWKYGVRLIRKGEFKNYAQDLAEDIGAIDGYAKWPMNCIDWDQAADELETEYSSFDFDGEEYLMRG